MPIALLAIKLVFLVSVGDYFLVTTQVVKFLIFLIRYPIQLESYFQDFGTFPTYFRSNLGVPNEERTKFTFLCKYPSDNLKLRFEL